ncbi:MAG: TrmH family RNA methyltransferase [Candidatus Pacebacteria bacterium]|jgi:23S rRNA (guanosine2251-2'-O)-methyltransferase|nr:TrmH family RNA methyltransferase [Candidatus Paceibacterota bacterium]
MRYVILHNIRSKYNVGAIFRTADAARVTKIFLSGYTPSPQDRFGRVDQEIMKTSLGAVDAVPFEYVPAIETMLERLKAEGVEIVAVEIAEGSVSLYDYKPAPDVAYIFGSEVEGVPKDILTFADRILEIPMGGQKESLNVSVTAGVVLLHHPYDVSA